MTNEAEWENILTPEQYQVLRKRGTEAPGSGQYDKHFESGMYVCAGCGTPLFSSEAKYDSGSGWPAFVAAKEAGAVELRQDLSHGMARTEVVCKTCGGHLGHVFSDGPRELHGQPTKGERYCINSVSLDFKAESEHTT